MVEVNVLAPLVLNHYVWEMIKQNTAMRETDYDGRMPIVPASQEPEFVEIRKPFLVYGFSEDPTPNLYAERSGSLSFAIYSNVNDDIHKIMNIIRAGLERQDESAREINSFTSDIERFIGIRFGSTRIGYFEGPGPEEEEGGRSAGVVTIRYNYFMDIPTKRFDPFSKTWV